MDRACGMREMKAAVRQEIRNDLGEVGMRWTQEPFLLLTWKYFTVFLPHGTSCGLQDGMERILVWGRFSCITASESSAFSGSASWLRLHPRPPPPPLKTSSPEPSFRGSTFFPSPASCWSPDQGNCSHGLPAQSDAS